MSIRLSRDGGGTRKAYRVVPGLAVGMMRGGVSIVQHVIIDLIFLRVLRNIFSFFSDILFSIDHVFYSCQAAAYYQINMEMEMRNQAAALENY